MSRWWTPRDVLLCSVRGTDIGLQSLGRWTLYGFLAKVNEQWNKVIVLTTTMETMKIEWEVKRAMRELYVGIELGNITINL